jgi:adenylate cyclase
MSIPWELRLYEKQELLDVIDLEGPAELGRQDQKDAESRPPERRRKEGEDRPYVRWREADGCWRVVIASQDEVSIPRRYLRVEPLPEGKVRLTNLNPRVKINLSSGELAPSSAQELALPVVLQCGKRTVRLQGPETEEGPLQHLDMATVPPGKLVATPPAASLIATPGQGVKPEALIQWLQGALGVLQSAAGSPDFFARAARALVDLVQLDSGLILLRDRGEWKTQAFQAAAGGGSAPDRKPSRRILNGVVREKRTVWRAPQLESLIGVEAVVAAPILDAQGEVIGALYGERRQRTGPGAVQSITRLEALLVELLAGGVAAGLARLEQERAALRARVQFEQFFTPELARQLEAQPDLLRGRDAEVTVLFCDLRGFSRISERLGPTRTVDWIGEVLGVISECVLNHGGVLVDYIGDELMAMWGAPERQTDHARRACRAALDMLRRLPELNERWQPVLGEAVGLRVGINSGAARVGNVGTPRKFKYGPLGNTVNLASRVQGATKYFRTKIILTHGTRTQLDADFVVRRLCRARVVNIEQPVDLYELIPGEDLGRAELFADYEKALARLENTSLHAAVRILGNILNEDPDDGPSLVLLSRAVDHLVRGPGEFDPVWELPGK